MLTLDTGGEEEGLGEEEGVGGGGVGGREKAGWGGGEETLTAALATP